MTTVVIAHAPEDALPARALAQKLVQMGVQPVVELPYGERLRGAMQSAAGAVALWSPRSVEEAEFVLDIVRVPRVIHVRMQNAALPHEFSTYPSVDLTGWRGEDNFPAWRELATIIAQTVGAVAPPPAAPPPPPAGFFQPGAPPRQAAPQPIKPPSPPPPMAAMPYGMDAARTPPPIAELPPLPPEGQPAVLAAPEFESDDRDFSPISEPKSGGKVGLIAAGVVAAAALLGGGYWFMQSSRADPALASAWENLDPNNADALRDFIAASTGPYRERAEDALAALEENEFDAAREADSIEAFQAFLADFPGSDHALVVRGRIAELRQSRALTAGDATDPELLDVPIEEGADPSETSDLAGDDALLRFGDESPDNPDEPEDAFAGRNASPSANAPGPSPLPASPAPVQLAPTNPAPQTGDSSTALTPAPPAAPQSLAPPPAPDNDAEQ